MTSPEADHASARRSGLRRWVPVAIAAAVALTLGIAAFAQQPGDTPTGASGSDAAPVVTSGSSSIGTVPGGGTTIGAATGTAESPTAVGTDTAGTDDVAAEVVQPEPLTQPTEGEKAPPIGPFGDLALRTKGDPLAVGKVDAPVVMVMFSDYRCPFCALFSQTLEQPLIDKYVDSGVLRIEWRDFPIFGSESARAAVAGRAAAAQGRFWEFNKAVYAAAPERGHPSLPDAQLVTFARQAGVADIARFTADLDNPDYIAAVAADFDEGGRIGVPATPSFIINGYPMQGAQPIGEFEQLIDTVATLAPAK